MLLIPYNLTSVLASKFGNLEHSQIFAVMLSDVLCSLDSQHQIGYL